MKNSREGSSAASTLPTLMGDIIVDMGTAHRSTRKMDLLLMVRAMAGTGIMGTATADTDTDTADTDTDTASI
jgi:hypothetical protein